MERNEKVREGMERLKVFDAYPKTADEFRVRTVAGAVLSVVCAVVIAVLVLVEARNYAAVEVLPAITVERPLDERVRINFNVTFPYIPCSFIEVDDLDVAGEHQLNPQHDITKTRLDVRGQAVVQTKVGLNDLVPKAAVKEAGCGSCYGAESDETPCCNTCEEVKAAYRRKGWTPDARAIQQCVSEVLTAEMLAQRDSSEGCNLAGYVTVNRVAGNFHIAPGRSSQIGSYVHTHNVDFLARNINVTHTIHRLSFGDAYPGVVNPLDRHVEVDRAGASMVQYFVKIVPTTYTFRDGTVISTNQYSVTEHTHHVELTSTPNGVPGMFVLYDVSPISVRYTEIQKSFLHFLTNVCAIVGGVITVAALLDSAIYRHRSSASANADSTLHKPAPPAF